jgi:hypothetical protein
MPAIQFYGLADSASDVMTASDAAVAAAVAQSSANQQAAAKFVATGAGTMALWGLLSAASVGVSAYHGYKRNDSVGWALGWGFLGGLFPVVTPAIALAQGLGKRKQRSLSGARGRRPARRRRRK